MSLNKKIICYLTTDAQDALEALKATGLDEDVAMSILEIALPEHELYELPDETPT